MFDNFDTQVTCEEFYNDNWYDEQYEIEDYYDTTLPTENFEEDIPF